MNTACFYHVLGLKIPPAFSRLLRGNDINETSDFWLAICRWYNSCFLQNSINWPCNHLHCLQIFICLVLAPELLHFAGKVVITVCVTKQTPHFSTTKLQFQQSSFSVFVFLSFCPTWVKNFDKQLQWTFRQRLSFASTPTQTLFFSITSLQMCLCNFWIERPGIHFHFFVTVCIAKKY